MKTVWVIDRQANIVVCTQHENGTLWTVPYNSRWESSQQVWGSHYVAFPDAVAAAVEQLSALAVDEDVKAAQHALRALEFRQRICQLKAQLAQLPRASETQEEKS